MSQTNINLKQISTISGFSISTVSKALNGKNDISSETKDVIQKIAKKLKYVPNYSAIALRKQRTNTLAIIVPHISDFPIAQFLSEVQKQAFIFNYRLLVFQSFYSSKNEIKCINQINDGSVDGIMLLTKGSVNLFLEKENTHHSIPIVSINSEEIIESCPKLRAQVLKYFNDLLIEIN